MSAILDERPEIARRAVYSPRSPQEEFIVPLLKAAIEAQLDRLLADRRTTVPLEVLDAGCGGQPFRARIENAGAAYHSLDVSPQAGVNVDFIAPVDAKHLPESIYEQGPFDLILCSEVLEHVAEWDAAFVNLTSLLAPSGYVILTCPHFFPLHEEPYDFWRPTPHAVRFFATKHGLEIESEEKLGSGWDVLGTFLARQRLRPRTRSAASRLFSRVCDSLRWRLFNCLRSGFLQKRVADEGPYYLSNLFVLRKQS